MEHRKAARSLPRQLNFSFDRIAPPGGNGPAISELEKSARDLLSVLGYPELGARIRLEWNKRLRTCAGRADTRRLLISLNPALVDHGLDHVEQTMRHELAHLLAQYRAGRRRIPPHGIAWRKACLDLGIPNEARCHDLPFEKRQLARPYRYRCPKCGQDFHRVRRIRRIIACLACCRKYARGKFDKRYQLRLAG